MVVGAAAQVTRDAVRQLRTRGIRVGLEKSDRRHDEPRHAERALEALLVHHRLLHRVERAVGRLEPFDGLNLPAADRVRENRTGVVRHIVDEHGARAALGSVAAQLRACEAELVAQRHRQRFLLHHVDAPHLAVHVQRHQAFHRAGRGTLAEDRRPAKEVRGCGHGCARGNHPLDERAA